MPTASSHQGHIALVLLPATVGESDRYPVKVHAHRLGLTIELPVPAPAIRAMRFKNKLAPAVENLHMETADAFAEQGPREKVIMVSVTVACRRNPFE